jgi:4-hydroxy-tetrahydrodipicolinate reductase
MQDNKLNIGLIGYGKMGKIIEKLALSRHHNVILKTNSQQTLQSQLDDIKSMDVAIEFTAPDTAPDNLRLLAQHGIPTVCGSTAWLDQFDAVAEEYNKHHGALLYASNFSIGVNIFFEINKTLARLMNRYNQYEPSIYESHHLEKKDAPSGTAVTIAQQILDALDRKSDWALDPQDDMQLKIAADRIGDVKGYHEVNYISEIDKISISHEAFSREGFALGAILAAEWLVGRQGIYGINDVLGI